MKKFKKRLAVLPVAAIFVALLMVVTVNAAPDEGMWTFDNLPVKLLQEKYGFTPTQEWLDHVRLASVRFMDGGSGSFVSPDGLVMTNHHVGIGQLQKMSTPEKNLVVTGFYAPSYEQEAKCADLELNVLVYMENVTREITGAVKKGMTDDEALKARKAAIARIEKKSKEKTGLRSNVVDLYHGGEYWLYRYKKYTDIRLVCAPERQAAYFGGDYDNFTYPRYDLDFCFFRVYENGKPIKSEHYFKWNAKGAAKDELVFVSGNPGSTDRLYTYSQLEYERDIRNPLILNYIDKWVKILRDYSKKGKEQQRRALIRIFGLENSRKAYTGMLQGLQDEELMKKKKRDEDNFRKMIAADPEWQSAYGDAWDTISEVIQKARKTTKQSFYRRMRGSRLAGYASTIVRYATEIKKPDKNRLDGFHDSQLDELKFSLFSPAPIYTDMEESTLAGLLQLSLDELGPDDPFIKTVLDGKTPAAVAKNLIGGTKLAEVDFRKKLFNGGQKAVEESKDPLIVTARKLDPVMRKWEEWQKKNIESVLTAASEKIAKARFAAYGKSTYPDATFTLRLAYGTVKGYPMNGTVAPYKTTLYGLYDRSLSFDKKRDWWLPERFWQRKDQLDLSTPVNFVSTCDIIGGNSGSPVINQKAEIVGLIFDGNIESLPGRYIFDESKNRAVAVHTAYIIEALRKLYDAGKLADEIEGIK